MRRARRMLGHGWTVLARRGAAARRVVLALGVALTSARRVEARPPARRARRDVEPAGRRARWRHHHADPFRTLRLQRALGRVSAEMRSAGSSRQSWAPAWRAHMLDGAYDALLREACEVAGADPLGEAQVARGATSAELAERGVRLERELALTARGWEW